MDSCSTVDRSASDLDSVSHPVKLSAVQSVGGIKCPICKQNFKYKKDFDAHYLEHNSNTKIQYMCTVCDRVLARYSTFRDHCYKQHARKEQFKCQYCTKSFYGQTNLNDHIEAVHKFKCTKRNCQLQFTTEKELHLHQFVHQCNRNKPPYECKTCKDMIDSIDMCEQHIDQHCTVMYYCPICEESLVKEDATAHLSMHFGNEDQTDDASNCSIKITPENSSINIVGGILCFKCNEIFKNRLEFETHFTADHPNYCLTYTCIICKKQYEKYSLFGSHIYEHLWKHKFGCSQCARHFPRLALLVEHVEAFHASDASDATDGDVARPFKCPHCCVRFATMRHRAMHLRQVHGSDRVACGWHDCDAEFELPKELLMHEKQHRAPYDAWCRQCGLHFPSRVSCEAHLEFHKKKQFLCPVCGRSYTEKYTVLKHISQHFVTVLHMCRVCAKIFSNKNRLVDHVKLHSSVKVFHCKDCGKGFMRSNHLEQHITIHTGQRPYKCDICDKTFASYPNYNKHMKNIHQVDGKKIKKCNVDKNISIMAASKNNPSMNTIWKQTEHVPDSSQPSSNNEVLDSEEHAADFTEMGDMYADPTAMPKEANFATDSNSINMKANSFFELLQTDIAGTFDLAQDILATPSAPPTAQPALIPREYGPDFGECADLDGAPLPHIPPLLTINPAPPCVSPPTNQHEYEHYEQNIVESTSKWEPPVFTKFYDTYYGELDDMAATRLSVMNTDIF